MRWEIIKRFETQIQPYLSQIKTVAIVGGGPDEAELKILEQKIKVKAHFYGIEPEALPRELFTFLDLNKEAHFEATYDLVICSQVLEHVWDHEIAFRNLMNLVSEDGIIWIGCPASNYAHGSPFYFSAGFSPDFIANYLNKQGFKILMADALGSKRYYFLTHAMQIWATEKMHRAPLIYGISRYYPRQVFFRIVASFMSSKVKTDIKWATETVVFAQNLNQYSDSNSGAAITDLSKQS
jgi:SAM-dependent methyltransferase